MWLFVSRLPESQPGHVTPAALAAGVPIAGATVGATAVAGVTTTGADTVGTAAQLEAVGDSKPSSRKSRGSASASPSPAKALNAASIDASMDESNSESVHTMGLEGMGDAVKSTSNS